MRIGGADGGGEGGGGGKGSGGGEGGEAATATLSVVWISSLTVGADSTVTARAADRAGREVVASVAALARAPVPAGAVSVTVAATLTLAAVTRMATWHVGAEQPR